MLFTRYSSFLSLSAVCLVYCCCTLAIVEAEAQAAQWQTEGQAMASEASSDNQPPPSSNDQAPPSSNGQAPPPSSNGQAPPPSSNGQAPPPSSNGQAPPPSSNGQAPPPSSNGQAPPPSSNGQVPALNGQSASPPLPSNQVNPTHVGPPPPPPPQPPTSTGANRVPPPPPPRQQPPPAPPPRQPRRVPSFLVPSAESSNEFDGTEASFVYVLPSRGRQCFHHRSAKAFEFSFRVLHGGRLDVDVYVVGPGGKVAYESRERRQGQFSAPAAPPSAAPASPTDLPVHTVCLDNRHSSWYEKVIDFGIRRLDDRRLKNASASEELESVQLEKLPEELSAELQRLDLRWSTFLSLTLAVEDNLHRSASLQRDSRGDETQDRLAMEDSAARVSRWSALQLVVMLAVSVIQVLMIRSLFDEKSVLHRVWRARSGAFLIGS